MIPVGTRDNARIVVDRNQCLRLKAYARIEEKTSVIAEVMGGVHCAEMSKGLTCPNKVREDTDSLGEIDVYFASTRSGLSTFEDDTLNILTPARDDQLPALIA